MPQDMIEAKTEEANIKIPERTGSKTVDFILHIREGENCASSTGSAPNPRQLLENEAQRRRVVVEDEWQTTEDCLDDGRLGDATYFLERMIAEAKRLKRCIEAAETLGPNKK